MMPELVIIVYVNSLFGHYLNNKNYVLPLSLRFFYLTLFLDIFERNFVVIIKLSTWQLAPIGITNHLWHLKIGIKKRNQLFTWYHGGI